MKKCMYHKPLALKITYILILFFKLKTTLYGLKQAPRLWYERLKNFLLSRGYASGAVDKTFFIRKHSSDVILVQVYVNDITFGSYNNSMCEEFVTTM